MTFDKRWHANGSAFKTSRAAASAAWRAGRKQLLIDTEVELPPAQERVLNYLADFWAKHGTSPTFRKMAHALGLSAPTVFGHIVVLERKGLVRRREHHPGINLVPRNP